MDTVGEAIMDEVTAVGAMTADDELTASLQQDKIQIQYVRGSAKKNSLPLVHVPLPYSVEYMSFIVKQGWGVDWCVIHDKATR